MTEVIEFNERFQVLLILAHAVKYSAASSFPSMVLRLNIPNRMSWPLE
jgi:hypothetical protein